MFATNASNSMKVASPDRGARTPDRLLADTGSCGGHYWLCSGQLAGDIGGKMGQVAVQVQDS